MSRCCFSFRSTRKVGISNFLLRAIMEHSTRFSVWLPLTDTCIINGYLYKNIVNNCTWKDERFMSALLIQDAAALVWGYSGGSVCICCLRLAGCHSFFSGRDIIRYLCLTVMRHCLVLRLLRLSVPHQRYVNKLLRRFRDLTEERLTKAQWGFENNN